MRMLLIFISLHYERRVDSAKRRIRTIKGSTPRGDGKAAFKY